MAIGQQETGCAVVELGVQPRVKGMAGFASGREICGHVIGIRGLLKIRQVTGRASRRKSLVLSDGGVLVTLLALHHGVRSEEWKSIEVLLDRLNRYLPAQYGVALGAVGAVLAAVNIRMAVRAVLADIRKDRLGVALGAVNFFVQPPEWIVVWCRD